MKWGPNSPISVIIVVDLISLITIITIYTFESFKLYHKKHTTNYAIYKCCKDIQYTDMCNNAKFMEYKAILPKQYDFQVKLNFLDTD